MRLPLLLFAVACCFGLTAFDASGTSVVVSRSDAAVDDESPDCSALDDPEARAEWEAILSAVEVLERGTRAEKLALFEHEGTDVDGPFDNDWPEPGCADLAVDRMIDRLRAWARGESDVWLLDLVAGNIAYWGNAAALPLFRDLARHSAPSLRARVIEHVDEMEDDEHGRALLQAMWARERVPWVQALLLSAIDDLDDSMDNEDVDPTAAPYDRCVELIRHDDRELAVAAMQCAMSRSLPGAQAALRRLIEDGQDELLPVALQELRCANTAPAPETLTRLATLWAGELAPPIRRSLFQVLARGETRPSLSWERDLLEGDDPVLAQLALRHIRQSDDPTDRALFIRTALEGPPLLRASAIELATETRLVITRMPAFLERVRDPSMAPDAQRAAMDAALSAAFADPSLRPEAHEMLSSAERRRFVTNGFEALSPFVLRAVRESWFEAALVEVRELEQNVWSATQCWSGLDATPWLSGRLARTGPDGTRRCHAAPGIEDASGVAHRRPLGSPVTAERRFDDGRSVWWEVSFDGGETCWFPDAQLDLPDSTSGSPEVIATGTAAPPMEFDLPIAGTLTEAFIGLEHAGLLTRFDPGQDLSGVRLHLEAASRAELEGLADAARRDEPLGKALAARTAVFAERLAQLDNRPDE